MPVFYKTTNEMLQPALNSGLCSSLWSVAGQLKGACCYISTLAFSTCGLSLTTFQP